MTSNFSVKEFILVTNDEYCFLKNYPQKEIKGLDCHEKQKQILAQVPASLEYPSSSEKKIEEGANRAIDQEQALIAQINLNSRFLDQKKSDRQASAPQESNTPEKV